MAPRRWPGLGEQPGLGVAPAILWPLQRAGLPKQGGCWGREWGWREASGNWQEGPTVGWRGGGTAWENTPRPLQPPAQREPRVGTAWPVNERRDTRKPGGHSRSIRAAGGKEQAGARAEEKMGVHGLAWCRVSVRTQHRVRPRAGLRETPSSEAEGHGGGAGRPRVGGAAPVSRCVSAPLREGEGRGERPCGGSGGWCGWTQQCWHGEEQAIGTCAAGRPGLSSGRCRWSRGEAGWWRGIWLSCWRCMRVGETHAR